MNSLIVLLLIIVILFLLKGKEMYMVDTNPMRRTAQFFDTCSPENMIDCPRNNNPYEGLPLP